MTLSRSLLALLVTSLWPLSCCCEEPECGDDVRDPGELCFEADRVGVALDLAKPFALRAGPFDADERPDLLVIGTDAGGSVTGRVLLADGDGGLRPARPISAYGCSAYPIAGDLDGDERHDLVFATCTNGLLVFRAADDYQVPLELPVGVPVRQAVVTDVDGDGVRDLLVLGLDPGGVPVLSLVQAISPGVFAPAFLTPQPLPALPDFTPGSMVAARIERDGRFEVVFAEPDRSGALARTHYQGAGVFAAPQFLGVDLRPAGLGLRDVDGDDRLDLLTADRARGQLATLLADGDDFVDGPRTELVDGWQSFALGQLDDDGWLDLAVVADDSVALLRGVGDGSFTEGVVLEFPAPVVELALLDLNTDGRDDLIAGTFAGGSPLTLALSGP